jgi:hypothetical protein
MERILNDIVFGIDSSFRKRDLEERLVDIYIFGPGGCARRICTPGFLIQKIDSCPEIGRRRAEMCDIMDRVLERYINSIQMLAIVC